ncbi:NHLP bacteriocin export ABC transporter permease/ATPase subunit, partial [Streptomyces palmae]
TPPSGPPPPRPAGTSGRAPAPARQADLVRGIDLALSGLGSLGAAEPPTAALARLAPGEEVDLADGACLAPDGEVVWTEVVHGCLSVTTAAGTVSYGTGAWAVLTGGGRARGEPHARLRVRRTADLAAGGLLRTALPRAMSGVLRSVDRLVARREERESARIVRAEEDRRAAEREAERALRSVLGPTGAPGPVPGAPQDPDPLTAVCAAVAGALGITLAAGGADPAAGSGPRTDPVEHLARRSGFRTRTVTLSGPWWRAATGPLVGYRADSGAPVALLRHRGRYRIWDPATGRRTTVTRASANSLRRSAVMFYRPLPEGPVGMAGLLRHGLRGTGADLCRIALAGLLTVALGALVPLATGTVLAAYVPSGQRGMIVQLCAILLAASVVSGGFAVVENTALLRLEGRFEATVQAAVWDRLLRLPVRFFSGYSSGDLAQTALGVGAARAMLSGLTTAVLHSGTVLLVNLATLFWLDPAPAALALAVLAACAVGHTWAGVRQVRWQHRLLGMTNALANLVFQILKGLPKIRVAGAESRVFARWAEAFARQQAVQRRIGRCQNAVAVLGGALPALAALGLFLLVSGPARHRLPDAEFLSFNAALAVACAAAVQLASALTSALGAIPLLTRIRPILAHPPEAAEDSTQPGELTGDIEVDRLSFGYTPHAPVLEDISFRVRPGEFLAVVGSSGCGKTTLLRLLLGFERPWSGAVRYDGQDLASLDGTAVRRQCAVVLQDAGLLSGTILEAITGGHEYTLDEAWAAADLAGVAEDIRSMPMGMQTLLGDTGTLSGGQRQRLVIAHALIRDPRILFFDEATSALDNAAQRLIAENTRRLNATRVVIAHRLSTVMDADKVLVLAAGRVAESGPPRELLARPDSRFARLVRRQAL